MDTNLDQDLKLLFNQVDDWFISLNEPISQFTLDDDKQKLALISRTTVNWFKTLMNPVTDEGIDDDDDDDDSICDEELETSSLECCETVKRMTTAVKKNVITRSNRNIRCKGPQRKLKTTVTTTKASISSEQLNLDSLAKDLELLLEGHDENLIKPEEHEPEFYFHVSYDDDETALLDDSIGCCCSLTRDDNSAKRRKLMDSSSSFDEESFVVVRSSDGFGCERRVDNNQQQQHNNQDLKIQISMPLDHDYLSKPRARPLVLSNRLIQGARNIRQNEAPVLNNEALKRFAKFSYQFRLLSRRNDSILAIENK